MDEHKPKDLKGNRSTEGDAKDIKNDADVYVALLGEKLRTQPPPADPISSEVTTVDQEEMLAEPTSSRATYPRSEDIAPPCFEVIQGADRDRMFILNPGLTLLGRGIDNDIILADVAVSRKHSQIQWDGAVVRYRDLGSGNGTRLNGAKINEAELKEGDRLDIGETVMIFRASSEHAKPKRLQTPPAVHSRAHAPTLTAEQIAKSFPRAEAGPLHLPVSMTHVGGPASSNPPATTATLPPGSQISSGMSIPNTWMPKSETTSSVLVPRSLLIAGLVAGLVLALLVGALGTWLWVRGPRSTTHTRSTKIDRQTQDDAMKAGTRAMEALQWDVAEKYFQQVLVREPTHLQAAASLERIRDGREHQALIGKSETLRKEGEFNKAYNLLGGVTVGSPVYANASAMRSRIIEDWVASDLKAAAHAKDKGDADAERSYLEHAVGVDPGNETARKWLSDLRNQRGSARGKSDRSRDRANDDVEADRRAIEYYRDGDFSSAATWMRKASQSAASSQRGTFEQRADEIDRFATLFGRIKGGAAPDTMIAQLRTAMQLDASISDGYYQAQLKSMLLAGYVRLYQRTSAEGQSLPACQNLQLILSIEKNHKQARSELPNCQRLVEKVFASARENARKDPGRAKAVYRELLTAVEPSSNLSKEIQKALRETVQ